MISTIMNLPLPTNHVFVDFENVQVIDHSIFDNKTVSFTLLLGASQKKVDAALVEKLLVHASSVHLVRLTAPGRNALDFTLAYYLGRAVLSDPTGFFHIVSQDKGYDPLIEHLRNQHVHARRHDDFTSLNLNGPGKLPSSAPAAKLPVPPIVVAPGKPEAPPLGENASRLLEYLRRNAKNRPGRERTLVRHIRSFFGDKITEAEASSLIADLHTAGYLSIDDKGRLTYHRLPASPAV
jgi:hypothetical protein